MEHRISIYALYRDCILNGFIYLLTYKYIYIMYIFPLFFHLSLLNLMTEIIIISQDVWNEVRKQYFWIDMENMTLQICICMQCRVLVLNNALCLSTSIHVLYSSAVWRLDSSSPTKILWDARLWPSHDAILYPRCNCVIIVHYVCNTLCRNKCVVICVCIMCRYPCLLDVVIGIHY